ncbi:MAG TPA: OmpH family outer membrane protein [Chitinophagaceae bacterium]|jgi:outer membrane protein|nr:OmpH family outer membrane protein [Chitinophagaceae bacterium]
MKNGLVVLNLILLIAVGVLFYLHFDSGKTGTTAGKRAEPNDSMDSASSPTSCKIAYFEMDSVAANFEMAKEMQSELGKKEDRINAELGRLQNLYQQKYIHLQQTGATMTNAQVDAAKNELMQLEQTIKTTKSNMDQDYQSYGVQKQQEILAMIRKFCAEYNKDKKFAIIISNEPGLVFYKDSTLDITQDLLKGLNEMYVKEKKKPSKKN